MTVIKGAVRCNLVDAFLMLCNIISSPASNGLLCLNSANLRSSVLIGCLLVRTCDKKFHTQGVRSTTHHTDCINGHFVT